MNGCIPLRDIKWINMDVVVIILLLLLCSHSPWTAWKKYFWNFIYSWVCLLHEENVHHTRVIFMFSFCVCKKWMNFDWSWKIKKYVNLRCTWHTTTLFTPCITYITKEFLSQILDKMCVHGSNPAKNILNWWKASRELKLSISVMSCGVKPNKNWKVFCFLILLPSGNKQNDVDEEGERVKICVTYETIQHGTKNIA